MDFDGDRLLVIKDRLLTKVAKRNMQGIVPLYSIMKKANSFSSWYVAGGYGPFGPNKSGLAAHSGEYYDMHVSETFGLHLEDVTRCGELILRRNGMY